MFRTVDQGRFLRRRGDESAQSTCYAPAVMNAPAPVARKRPWFLVVALVVSSLFGATSFVDGWSILSYYRTTQIDVSAVVRDLDDDHDRKAAQAALERYVDALDADKHRMFPLAAAELLLGIALFGTSAAAMAGRGGGRAALVQVVAVQAAVIVLMFALTARVRSANRELGATIGAAQLRKSGNDPKVVEDSVAISKKIAPAIELLYVVGRTTVAGLVLVALTRRRTRSWYEPQAEG
jgi:hypothetical protein